MKYTDTLKYRTICGKLIQVEVWGDTNAHWKVAEELLEEKIGQHMDRCKACQQKMNDALFDAGIGYGR